MNALEFRFAFFAEDLETSVHIYYELTDQAGKG